MMQNSDELAPYVVKASKGDVLFEEGQPGEDMYFVHSGKVRIEKEMDGHKELLAVMEKGDFFGEMALLDHSPRSASAIVEEDAQLLKVDSSHFEKLLQGNIEIAVRMIRKYAARVREANEKIQLIMRDRKEMNKEIQEIIHSARSSKKSQEQQANVNSPLAYFEDQEKNQFPVLQSVITLGRFDPVTNISPDIDFSEIDKQRSISRKHARLEYINHSFVLTEEIGVSNGTMVNGEKLIPGQPISISNHCVVSFGNVTFTFHILSTS